MRKRLSNNTLALIGRWCDFCQCKVRANWHKEICSLQLYRTLFYGAPLNQLKSNNKNLSAVQLICMKFFIVIYTFANFFWFVHLWPFYSVCRTTNSATALLHNINEMERICTNYDWLAVKCAHEEIFLLKEMCRQMCQTMCGVCVCVWMEKGTHCWDFRIRAPIQLVYKRPVDNNRVTIKTKQWVNIFSIARKSLLSKWNAQPSNAILWVVRKVIDEIHNKFIVKKHFFFGKRRKVFLLMEKTYFSQIWSISPVQLDM